MSSGSAIPWRFALAGSAATLALTAVLFVGFERRIGEHDDSYTLFVKQTPTLRSVYLNAADCGMCEVVSPLEDFSEEKRRSFGEFCRVRFGIADLRMCFAIFREQDLIEAQTLPDD